MHALTSSKCVLYAGRKGTNKNLLAAYGTVIKMHTLMARYRRFGPLLAPGPVWFVGVGEVHMSGVSQTTGACNMPALCTLEMQPAHTKESIERHDTRTRTHMDS